MSSFTEFAYNIAEKAFKTPPGNKKTMATVASKGRWLFIISAFAFVAAAADDANLRGPARDALAPQDLDLAGEPNPQEAPAPRDAERRDVAPAGLVTRRLKGVLQDDGWTSYHGMRLLYEPDFEDMQVHHLIDCKQSCLERDWCRGIHFSEGEGDNCSLLSVAAHDDVDITMGSTYKYYKYDSCSPETYGELVATEAASHYVAPTGQALVDARRELGYIDAMQDLCDAERVADDGTIYSHLGDGADLFLPYCDVSDRRDFRNMFLDMESTADLSRWNVSAGTSFTGMFSGAKEFSRDLSGWMIHAHAGDPDNKLLWMFIGSGMSDVRHCPCIERPNGPWLQYCPGKRLDDPRPCR